MLKLRMPPGALIIGSAGMLFFLGIAVLAMVQGEFVIATPVLICGALVIVRSPFVGVDCTEDRVIVHGLLWNRRIPLHQIVGMDVRPYRQPRLHWMHNDDYRSTALPFGRTRFSLISEQNQAQVQRLNEWVEDQRGKSLPVYVPE